MGTNPEIETKPTAAQRRVRRLLVLPLLLAFGAVVLREVVGARTVLVTQSPSALNWIASLTGLLFGLAMMREFLSIKVPGQSKLQKYFAALMLVPLLVVAFSHLGRWMFELAAFTNSGSKPRLAQVKIMASKLSSRSAGYRLEAMALLDGRRFDVFVTEQVNSEIGAIRPPVWKLNYAEQQNCLQLPLEDGRWGVIRAHVPALWDDSLDTYGPCQDAGDKKGN